MASPTKYPDKLPCPTAAPVTPTERRAISDIPGDKNYRALQRDFHGTQELTWIFNATQANVFNAWWRGTLRRGGFWFAADWPLPGGNDGNVYRFMTPPAWSFQPGGDDKQGIFTVTAKVEIRGRGMMPKDYLVVALTSRPYPLDPSDEMTGSADYLGGQIFGWPADEVLPGADFLGGTLTYEYHGHVAFATGPDEMTGSADFLGGTLVGLNIIRYDNYLPESMSTGADFLGGTLTLGV